MTNFFRSRVIVPAAAVVAALSLVACSGSASEPEKTSETYRNPDLTKRTERLAEAFSDAAMSPSEDCRHSLFRENQVSQIETLTLSDGTKIVKESELEDDGSVSEKIILFNDNVPWAKMTPTGARLVDNFGNDIVALIHNDAIYGSSQFGIEPPESLDLVEALILDEINRC